MRHIVRDTAWCVIDLVVHENRVFLQQRWRYNWLVMPPLLPWSETEKTDFHNRADRNIWAAWSNRAKLKVTGPHPFRNNILPINLDIRRVSADHHWTVNVMKIAPGVFRTSNVVWNTRTINLDTNDFQTRTFTHTTAPRRTHQVPVAHEFGHAAGNTRVLGRGDENPAGHAHNADQASIMHSGNQLRARHFRTILDEMNKMIYGCTFTVHSV